MSHRPEGRRGRRKPDPAEETASWLLEIEQAGQADEEEDDWSDTLRATRREATGQFPAVPSDGPSGPGRPAAAPGPARPTEPPAPPPAAGHRPPPAGMQGTWFAPDRPGQAAGHDTGGWGGAPAAPPTRAGAEPPAQEPPAWEAQAEAEPWNGRWPFEDTSQSWEPDDRSYTWPAQELPATTGNWEAGPAPSEDPWATPSGGGYTGSPGYDATGYQAASPPAGGYADPRFGNDSGYADDPGGYAPPAGHDRGYEQAAGGYPAAGGYDTGGGYESAGHEATNGYEAASYDGTGGYQAAGYDGTGGYQAAGYDGTGGYAPTGGHDTSGDLHDAGNPYSTSGGPFATEDQYPPHDPYAAGGAYGGRDAAGTADPRQAADPSAPHEPYPGHDPFAAYGLQGSRRAYGAGESEQAAGSGGQTSFHPGETTGPIGGGRATGEIWPPVAPGPASPAAPPPRPEIWPAQTGTWGIEEPPSRPRQAATGEFSRALESDEEQVVRLGRGMDDRGGGTGPLDPGSRVRAARSNRSGEARHLDDGHYLSHRARWPRVVALISWIILLMVLCWFYVFPWLEKILPENF